MPPIAFQKAITPVLNNTTTSTSLTYSIAPGDFVIVTLAQYTQQSISISITDDGGNTYNPGPVSSFGGSPVANSFYTFATHPATTITGTVSAFTNSWTLGAVTYNNVGNIGNTGNVNNTTTSTTKSITGTLHATNNWMFAGLVFRGSLGATATVGNLRAVNAGATDLALMDNTGALSLNCTLTTTQTGISTGVFIELLTVPGLTSVSPNSGVTGTTVAVTLTGTNFTGATGVSVSGSGITVTGFTVVSDTSITANFVLAANASLGTQNITVTTASGQSSNGIAFTVNPGPPTITSISPNIGLVGTTVAVAILGTNFTAPVTITVSGTGVTVTGITLISSTQVNANFVIAANATPLTRTVTVTTPTGSANFPGFTVALRLIRRSRAWLKYGFRKRLMHEPNKPPSTPRPKRG